MAGVFHMPNAIGITVAILDVLLSTTIASILLTKINEMLFLRYLYNHSYAAVGIGQGH